MREAVRLVEEDDAEKGEDPARAEEREMLSEALEHFAVKAEQRLLDHMDQLSLEEDVAARRRKKNKKKKKAKKAKAVLPVDEVD